MAAFAVGDIESLEAWVAYWAGIFLACVLTLLLQYRWRRPFVAAGAGLASAIVVLVGVSGSRLNAVETPLAPPDWADRPGAATLTVSGNAFREGDNPNRIILPVRVAAVPPGWLASVTRSDATVGSADLHVGGSEIPAGETLLFADSSLPARRVALQGALAVARLGNDPYDIVRRTFGFALGDRAQTLPAVVNYTGSLVMQFSHAEMVATAPLLRGATVQDGPYRLRIDEIRLVYPPWTIRATEYAAAPSLDRLVAPTYELYAINPARSEAVSLNLTPSSSSGPPFLCFSAHFPIFGAAFTRRGVMSIPWPTDSEVRVDSDWLAGAHLALVRWTPAGSVQRNITIPALTICSHAPPGC